jgi:hypothetical protein
MKLHLSLLSALVVLSFAAPAEARSFRVKDIPNGNKYGCTSCHTSNSGKTNTAFGNDSEKYLVGSGLKSQRHTDWAQLCPLDSDGDGLTNGEELNDPDCNWVRGQANPGGATSNPGKASSVLGPTCGNGKLDAGENCDGGAMSATTCDEIGAGNGLLTCTAQCTFDTSDCSQDPATTSGGDVTSGAGGGDGGGSGSSHYGNTPPVLPTACSFGVGDEEFSAWPVVLGAAALAITTVRRAATRRPGAPSDRRR